MKKRLFPLLVLAVFCSHDMFLKMDSYFLEPGSGATIKLFNGTFERSENVIARNRMTDASLLGNGVRTPVDSTQWSEKDSITILSFETGRPGTWVAGVSTRPRNIELAAADFNAYLEHDGVLDMLEWRRENGAMETDAVERYSKHVKTLFQVGEILTDDWQTPLGYPIEFVPLANPYDLHPGHSLPVKLLFDGQPLAGQLVYVGADLTGDTPHTHGEGEATDHEHGDEAAGHTHAGIQQLRTDGEGIVNVDLSGTGTWYLRTIYMTRVEEQGLTHESNWATLTFAIGEGHSHAPAEGAHTHQDEGGMPSWVWWAGSLLLLGALFLWFNRKK